MAGANVRLKPTMVYLLALLIGRLAVLRAITHRAGSGGTPRAERAASLKALPSAVGVTPVFADFFLQFLGA